MIWVCGDITKTAELISTFKSWDIPSSDCAFWIAGEDQIIRDLRRYIRREKVLVVMISMRSLTGDMAMMRKVTIMSAML